ncbi:MAG: sigma-70 family RNA polymerase sigma factor [Chthoniobacterales bacterium]
MKHSFLPTRRSLVEKLANHDDHRLWHEFHATYRKLIHHAARRSGLSESEADEVVQETLITVSKNIGRLRYDPEIGSFKGWLLNITRWRIADQFRKREPGYNDLLKEETGRTAALDRLPDGAGRLSEVWEKEWRTHLLEAALANIKKRVEPRHYQVFDCHTLKEWPVQKVASELQVNIAQVYLICHRIRGLLKAEVKRLDSGKI